jgi:hypothetical protein
MSSGLGHGSSPRIDIVQGRTADIADATRIRLPPSTATCCDRPRRRSPTSARTTAPDGRNRKGDRALSWSGPEGGPSGTVPEARVCISIRGRRRCVADSRRRAAMWTTSVTSAGGVMRPAAGGIPSWAWVCCDVVAACAGIAAPVSAMAANNVGARLLVLERAPKHMRGGNTRRVRNIRCLSDRR